MTNPEIGSELFSSYEAELKLIQAELNQKLDQIPELTGEPRKSAVKQAERALEEASELVRKTFPSHFVFSKPIFFPLAPCSTIPSYWSKKKIVTNLLSTSQLDQMRIEKQNIPATQKSRINQSFRNFTTDIDTARRLLTTLSSDRRALFGNRYTDDPDADSRSPGDAQLEQRQQLLSGTERLDRSSQRLRESQRIANETEDIGRGTLADLQAQREQIQHTRMTILESEGYVDRSVKTLRGMARR